MNDWHTIWGFLQLVFLSNRSSIKFGWSTKSRLSLKRLVEMAIWHITSNSDWTLRKVTHGTLLFLFSQCQSLKAAPPTSVYVKYFYRRRDELSCWSATVSRMKLSQSFTRSPRQPYWQLQRRWSRWDSPETLSFISSHPTRSSCLSLRLPGHSGQSDVSCYWWKWRKSLRVN